MVSGLPLPKEKKHVSMGSMGGLGNLEMGCTPSEALGEESHLTKCWTNPWLGHCQPRGAQPCLDHVSGVFKDSSYSLAGLQLILAPYCTE